VKDTEKIKGQLREELEELGRKIIDPEKSGTQQPTVFTDKIDLIVDNLLSGMIYQVVLKNDEVRSFTCLSDTVRRFYGITPEEGIADPSLIYGRVHEEDRFRLFQEEEKAIRSLSPFRSEVRMIGPTGEIRWSLFVSHPRRLADESICWDGIEIDITDN
jgi:PAS domain-containing protein